MGQEPPVPVSCSTSPFRTRACKLFMQAWTFHIPSPRWVAYAMSLVHTVGQLAPVRKVPSSLIRAPASFKARQYALFKTSNPL